MKLILKNKKNIDFTKIEEIWNKKNIQNVVYSIFIATIIVFICNFSNSNFFFFDDAQNEFLPYLKETGRIWLKGEIPFIIKNTIIGQNQLIEFHRAIFLPQNILISILSNVFSFEVVASILAFINLLIISFFSLKIGEALDLKEGSKKLLTFLFAINPIFIYMYSSSWWNEASAQTWFVVALASIFLLRKNFRKKYLILNVVSVLFLFVAGWSQALLFYFFLVIFFVIEKIKEKEYRELGIFSLIFIGIILVVSTVFSEYFLSLKLVNIGFGFGNFENFLSPNLNQMIMTFNPVYYTFMNRYGGYLITYIPMAFSSIYILILLCYQKNFWKKFFKNENIKFISLLLLMSFILSQLPAQLGLMRLPFKFLPIFSEMLIIFSIYGLEISELEFTKIRNNIFLGIILISCILSFFSVEGDHMKVFKINIIFVILSIFQIYSISKDKEIRFLTSSIYTLFMLLLMLFMQPTVDGILPNQQLKRSINLKNNFNKNGYFLALTNGNDVKDNLEDLYSAQFLLYGVKSVNGYTRSGNNKISELLDVTPSQSFNEKVTINNLSKKFNEICYFDLLNIDSIAIKKEKLTKDMQKKLLSCDYSEKSVKNPKIDFFIKNQKNIGSISYASKGIEVKEQITDKENLEKYQLSSSDNGFIVLSKVYWKGYKAYINGKRVNISSEKGLIKLDNIPNNLNNATLEIKYFPSSWKITIWLSLIGIIIIVCSLFNAKEDIK